ncbi:hypothetical protein [Kurthia massiliensis]|uniref:hypothetical protein n=1 Tax=Kurthia massiliensis TaxID=1033739 RepID=UPI0002897202|nr:hypothetical protein [Kurthia massiliensis]
MGSLDLEMYFEQPVLTGQLNSLQLHDLEDFQLYTCTPDLAIQRDFSHNAVLYIDEVLNMPKQEDLTLLPLYEQAYLETMEKHCNVLAHYKTTTVEGHTLFQVSVAVPTEDDAYVSTIVAEAAAMRDFILSETLYTFRRKQIRLRNVVHN